jgi:radical SAM superfamily enzyme YgiQ (UPF0313 family)
VAGAARRAGLEVAVVDLNLAADPDAELAAHFDQHRPELVGLSFRNVDDCFWPGHVWFVPELIQIVAKIRARCDAPIVLGGVGYSIFARQLVERTGAEFGVRGDGEKAVVELVQALRGGRRPGRVPGLVWWEDGVVRQNPPAWPPTFSVPTERDAVDNAAYFRRGGQLGVETRRGCDRLCAYCADPLAKGPSLRLRDPAQVAVEVESLLSQGIDVLHLCDSEFNVPAEHALAVCEELIRRRLGERVRWYAYLAVVPFGDELAGPMRRAGCVGIDFTADSASPDLLVAYRQPHRQADLAEAVAACRRHGIAVMLDLLLGGPGETPASVAETLDFIRRIDPDCAGAALGVRLYPGTLMARRLAAEVALEEPGAIHRRYAGPIDLVQPSFYVSPALGEHPARLVRELIAGDARFFEPADPEEQELCAAGAGHNYNENRTLVEAIAAGARGAYWDILRRIRQGGLPERPRPAAG